jgi:hypothetical protein
MANRRMFAKQIIDTDFFMELPATSQMLYFHLALRADDDGFVGSPKRILRLTDASEDDYKLLLAKDFLIPFDSGVCVIKHWRIHNYIQKDRYNKTIYKNELSQLERDENGAYTECIHDVYMMDTQVRLGKVRLGKVSKESVKRKAIYTTIEGYPVNETTHNKLVESYTLPTVLDYYERISDYVSNKNGKDYKDYAGTARNWIKKDIAEGRFKRAEMVKSTEPDELEQMLLAKLKGEK